MVWAKLQYNHDEVDRAGATLLSPPVGEDADRADFIHALDILSNWRSCHAFPLNTLQVNLRNHSKEVDQGALVAQRIKRLTSIAQKLRRFDWIKLSQMQDIGGCRAIVRSVRAADRLAKRFRNSQMRHHLIDEDDYIRNPKKSGYRSLHLIYAYESDRNTTYNGLKIEVQIRSSLQHAWATAVETVGTFTQQVLKSSRGSREWLRFFALMSTAIALREKTKPVPKTPTDKDALICELRQHATELDVEHRLKTYGHALNAFPSDTQDADYFLLKLEPAAQKVTISGFTRKDLPRASGAYLDVERAIANEPGAEAVLVSVDSVEALRRAYPNYFLDTRLFLDALREALS